MAITYPLAIPTVGVQSLTWTNANVSIVSRSPFTFQGQVQNYAGQIRFASVSISDVLRDSGEEWVGFLDALQGSRGTFLMGDPSGKTPRGTARTNVLSRTAQPAGQSTLLIKGGPTDNNRSRFFEAGDWIQIGSGLNSRLYKVTRLCNLYASGEGNVEIWPALRKPTAVDDPVIVTNTVGLFRLSNGTYSYLQDNTCRYSVDFDCEEVI